MAEKVPVYGEMNPQQLLATLKEKDKELSKTEKKLKKVESKFVEMHETRTQLKSDRDTFLNFLTLVFPEPTLAEVLLPKDQIGHYDIDHLRQFWQLQQSKNASNSIIEANQMTQEIEILKEQVTNHEETSQKMQTLEASIEVLRTSENDYQAQNSRLTSQLAKKEKEASEVQKLREECEKLRDQVQELQRDNSAQQAKILMSAFGGAGASGSSGIGSLLGGPSSSTTTEEEPSDSQVQRTTQLEREVSTLTNSNLKLQEQNAELNHKLQEQIALQEPEMQETNQRLIEEEIAAKVAQQAELNGEEVETLRSQNGELLQKLQAITNEFAVMKSDAEIVKQKARQMLIDKDEELERMRTSKANNQGAQTHQTPTKQSQYESKGRQDSQPDSGASTFSEGAVMVSSVMEADNSQMLETSPSSQETRQPILPRGLDIQYVRSILLKYLEYMASGENEKEALTLEKVLFTVLEASPNHLASLERTRQRNNTGIMSFFYDQPNTQVAKPLKPRSRQFMGANSMSSAESPTKR